MKMSRIQTISLRRKTVKKDDEGVPVVKWGSATQIQCETWPAGGQLQVNTYGDRVNNMLNVRVRGPYQIVTEGKHQAYKFVTGTSGASGASGASGETETGFTLCEGDGLCINVSGTSDPDYKIISITPYKPLKMEVERI